MPWLAITNATLSIAIPALLSKATRCRLDLLIGPVPRATTNATADRTDTISTTANPAIQWLWLRSAIGFHAERTNLHSCCLRLSRTARPRFGMFLAKLEPPVSIPNSMERSPTLATAGEL